MQLAYSDMFREGSRYRRLSGTFLAILLVLIANNISTAMPINILFEITTGVLYIGSNLILLKTFITKHNTGDWLVLIIQILCWVTVSIGAIH